MVRTICERMGRDFDESTEVAEERLGQDKAYVIDSTKARTELGWRPEIGLEEGIDRVVSWVEAGWAQIQHEPLEYVHKP